MHNSSVDSQTSSRWCGGGSYKREVPAQMSSSPFDYGSKLLSLSPKALVLVNMVALIFIHSLAAHLLPSEYGSRTMSKTRGRHLNYGVTNRPTVLRG
ncbi:hypothetical protein TNCV_1542601 [Trichonephila clavipes]|nr:hypothetical protein TNCV_1542601 [Trichonephila clavipes]